MFGREQEMDLGQASSRPSVPGPATQAPREPYVPGPRITALFVVAVLVGLGLMFVRAENDALDDPVKQAARGEITPRSARSLLRAENLSRAVRVVDARLQAEGFIDSFRLEPTRLNVILVQPSGARESVQVDVAFATTSTDAGTGEGEGLQPRDVDVDAPLRILRAAQRDLGLKVADLDYLVLSKASGEGERPTWSGFYKRPLKDNDIAAAFDGSDVRLLGTPDAKTRAEQRRAERIQQCLREAKKPGDTVRCSQ